MKLHPFAALRPTNERAAQVMSPPYDVVDTQEARALAAGKPDSFLHVIRPDIDLPDDTDPYDDAVYAGGAAALARLVEDGVLVEDDAPAIWLYRITQGEHAQLGFVGCAEVADYAAGRVKRHELTRRKKEDDRTRHILELGAQAGPVFLACRAAQGLSELAARLTVGPPTYDLTAHDGVQHTLWAVREAADLEATAAALAPLEAFYIADGHHRAASAARAAEVLGAEHGPGPWDRFLVVVFPDDQLRILGYHRVVTELNGLSKDAFLARVSEAFEVGDPGEAAAPASRHTFTMYLDGAWYPLSVRPSDVDEADPVASLDVAILQERLLEPILGIADLRGDPRIGFVGGSRGLGALSAAVDAAGDGVAFALYPTSLGELFQVADAGLIMPPKSTWFEPKLASGLLVHRIRG